MSRYSLIIDDLLNLCKAYRSEIEIDRYNLSGGCLENCGLVSRLMPDAAGHRRRYAITDKGRTLVHSLVQHATEFVENES